MWVEEQLPRELCAAQQQTLPPLDGDPVYQCATRLQVTHRGGLYIRRMREASPESIGLENELTTWEREVRERGLRERAEHQDPRQRAR
jgi:hypothetical protein